jgi:sulfate adenylyltransferase
MSRNARQYAPVDEVEPHETKLTISGTELRRRLRLDLDIPPWFSFPEVIGVLKERHPPLSKQGFTLFFTGLSGSGKSTIAKAVMTKLMEAGGRRVTLLDGDVVRKHLSSELGFSREHRNLNIERIGFVASEITKNGGIAICAPIAPYAHSRRVVREMIEPLGGFIEIHISTPMRFVKAATARASTPRPVRACSRSSRAFPTLTRSQSTPRCGSTPRASRSTRRRSKCCSSWRASAI